MRRTDGMLHAPPINSSVAHAGPTMVPVISQIISMDENKESISDEGTEIEDMLDQSPLCAYENYFNGSTAKGVSITPSDITYNGVSPLMNDDAKNMSKPRTALFKGGEDDEPKVPQIIQLGSFLFDLKENKITKGDSSNSATLPGKLIFQGIDIHEKAEKQSKRFILIGAMHVEMPG